MRLIPQDAHSTEEIQDAERLAEGLKRTAESTVVGTAPLIPDPPGGRPVSADRIGMLESVIPKESAEVASRREAAELAEIREKTHAAELEKARYEGRIEGLNEGRAA